MNAPRNQATLEDASTSLLVGVGLLLLSICLFFGFFSGMLNVDEGTFGFLFMLMVLAFFSSAPLIYYGMRHFGYDSGASVFLMYLVLFILGFIILFFGMVLSAGP
jgi:drug/metabolite transporter (DMT)-like permease